ncbi:hypothetical protein JCM21900_002587 [Sporobolomyces salmonicolor]
MAPADTTNWHTVSTTVPFLAAADAVRVKRVIEADKPPRPSEGPSSTSTQSTLSYCVPTTAAASPDETTGTSTSIPSGPSASVLVAPSAFPTISAPSAPYPPIRSSTSGLLVRTAAPILVSKRTSGATSEVPDALPPPSTREPASFASLHDAAAVLKRPSRVRVMGDEKRRRISPDPEAMGSASTSFPPHDRRSGSSVPRIHPLYNGWPTPLNQQGNGHARSRQSLSRSVGSGAGAAAPQTAGGSKSLLAFTKEGGCQELRLHSKGMIDTLVRLAYSGALRIELVLQHQITMPLLYHAKLPTNLDALTKLSPSMKLLPGFFPHDYLTTFQLWHQWTSTTKIPCFPICGPLVGMFLDARIHVPALRPKVVFVLEAYRKATIKAFVGLRKSRAAWDEEIGRKWGDTEWAEWERYVEMAQSSLGEWKLIEELAPPPPVPSTTPLAAHFPFLGVPAPTAPVPSTSAPVAKPKALSSRPALVQNNDAVSHFQPRPAAAGVSGLSKKAQGKRRAVDPHSAPAFPADVAFETPAFSMDHQHVVAVAFAMQSDVSPVQPVAVKEGANNINNDKKKRKKKKKKLPPEEKKEEDEFYKATAELRDAMAGLLVKREMVRRAQGQAAVEAQQPAPAALLRPYSDFTPSLAAPYSSNSLRVVAPLNLDPFNLLQPLTFTSTAGPAPTLTSTAFPLAVTAHPLSPFPHPSAAFTLTPRPFLPYPRALQHDLDPQDQATTWSYAQNLCVMAADQAQAANGEETDPDAREARLKEKLVEIVRDAIKASKLKELPEAREPTATKTVREWSQSLAVDMVEGQRARQKNGDGKGSESGVMSSLIEASAGGSPLNAAKPGKDKEVGGAVKVANAALAASNDSPASKQVSVNGRRDRDAEQEEGQPVSAAEVQEALAAPTASTNTTTSNKNLVSAPPPATPVRDIPDGATPVAPPIPRPTSPWAGHVALPSRRPSLSSGSASAPAVPLARGRANSNPLQPPAGMRRRPSVSAAGPGVHPLAQLYASQSPKFRQGVRLQALAIARQSSTPPASARVGSSVSPPTGGAVSTAQTPTSTANKRVKPSSPPLIPIPLNGGGLHDAPGAGADAIDVDKPSAEERRASEHLHPPLPPSGSSALEIILEVSSPRRSTASSAGTGTAPQPSSGGLSPSSVPPAVENGGNQLAALPTSQALEPTPQAAASTSSDTPPSAASASATPSTSASARPSTNDLNHSTSTAIAGPPHPSTNTPTKTASFSLSRTIRSITSNLAKMLPAATPQEVTPPLGASPPIANPAPATAAHTPVPIRPRPAPSSQTAPSSQRAVTTTTVDAPQVAPKLAAPPGPSTVARARDAIRPVAVAQAATGAANGNGKAKEQESASSGLGAPQARPQEPGEEVAAGNGPQRDKDGGIEVEVEVEVETERDVEMALLPELASSQEMVAVPLALGKDKDSEKDRDRDRDKVRDKVRDKDRDKDRDEDKDTEQDEEMPPPPPPTPKKKPLRDHPLRHVPKHILLGSEPIRPFGPFG